MSAGARDALNRAILNAVAEIPAVRALTHHTPPHFCSSGPLSAMELEQVAMVINELVRTRHALNAEVVALVQAAGGER